jgi:hypothetical protein
MRRTPVALSLALLLVISLLGCGQDQVLEPAGDISADDNLTKAMPPQYYTNYWTAVGMNVEMIDVVHGAGVPVLEDLFLDQYPGKGFAAGLGLAFDLDGSAYIINNWLLGDDPYLAELTKFDVTTGTSTVIASLGNHFCGSEIDACGNLYSVGFEPPPPNYGYYFSPLYGDKLCRIDKYTGEVTPIGNGTGLPDVMDLAFDSEGTLWATTDNKMYTIGLDDGVATWVSDITNVPPTPPGETNPMMIMSIAFDKHDRLYGTAMVGFCVVCDPAHSPIMRIDPYTGEGTVLGWSELGYNHGGDTMPTEIRIVHKAAGEKDVCITVDPKSLPTHLAHGDYVPGTNGYDCDCP